jgi:hypothetical protein
MHTLQRVQSDWNERVRAFLQGVVNQLHGVSCGLPQEVGTV